MAEVSADSVIIDIQRGIDALPPSSVKPCIFRVDSHLRRSKRDHVYEPEMVAIGPFHHGNQRLQTTEPLKYMYLKRLLKRINEQGVDKFVNALTGMEKRARGCYAETLEFDDKDFIKLMLLDTCFVIELLRYNGIKSLRESHDSNFKQERITSQLRHDMLLLENQLPFFVVNQLFNMTKTNENPEDELISLALTFANGMFLNLSITLVPERIPVKDIDHLFGLIHYMVCLPFEDTFSPQMRKNNKLEDLENVNSISRLREIGIKLRKLKQNKIGLMNIRFVNGVLKIPKLSIYDETESQFRNLIAYEQYLTNMETRYVSDYTFFMHCLINTPKDVEILRNHGIIENWLGDDEEVCSMFNRLGKNILTSSKFGYSQIFYEVNNYSRRRTKKWNANLRRNYFNSPWSIIKFVAAVMLLLLTLTQTAYTVLGYYYRRK